MPAASLNASLLRDLSENLRSVAFNPTTSAMIGVLLWTPELAEHETNRAFHSWVDRPHIDRVFESGDMLGSASIHLGAGLGLYFAGRRFQNNGIAVLGSDITSSAVLSGTIAVGLKMLTARTRPDGSPYSFPSGHSTIAFSTAGVISHQFGLVPGTIAQITAAYVGLSRLQENKHYISDIIAGAALGNLIAYQVVNRRQVRDRLMLTPVVGGGEIGLSLGMRF